MATPSTYQIAIDGPSGSGKSTLARNLAARLGFIYIDTGALYRTIGLFAARQGIPADKPEAVCPVLSRMDLQMRLEADPASVSGACGSAIYLDGKRVGNEIRTPDASWYASQVARLPEVRTFLLEIQRSIARQNHVIMDGRDIGTVILPDAQCKLFLAPSPVERARRRYEELIARGEQVTEEQVLADVIRRDENDANRETAPAKPAPDAVFLDNSAMTPNETLEAALTIIRQRIPALADPT